MTQPAAEPGVCEACGRQPAAALTIRRHVGMVVMQRFVKVKAQLCRECAGLLVKRYTLRTLWQGWWGYISFFVNWFVLAANLRTWLHARRLAAPLPPEVGMRAGLE